MRVLVSGGLGCRALEIDAPERELSKLRKCYDQSDPPLVSLCRAIWDVTLEKETSPSSLLDSPEVIVQI